MQSYLQHWGVLHRSSGIGRLRRHRGEEQKGSGTPTCDLLYKSGAIEFAKNDVVGVSLDADVHPQRFPWLLSGNFYHHDNGGEV